MQDFTEHCCSETNCERLSTVLVDKINPHSRLVVGTFELCEMHFGMFIVSDRDLNFNFNFTFRAGSHDLSAVFQDLPVEN